MYLGLALLPSEPRSHCSNAARVLGRPLGDLERVLVAMTKKTFARSVLAGIFICACIAGWPQFPVSAAIAIAFVSVCYGILWLIMNAFWL